MLKKMKDDIDVLERYKLKTTSSYLSKYEFIFT